MSDFINNLRDLNVGVMHPRDKTADALLRQIHRIGCGFESIWPIPSMLPENIDILFVDVDETSPLEIKPILSKHKGELPAIVAMIEYENPSVLEGLFEIKANAVITKPVRAAGVMSSILMARQFWSEQRRFDKEISKIRARLDNLQKLNDAKFILMRHHGIDDKDAYAIIRKQAMAKRVTTVEIAQSIINADGILRDFGKG
ncbi:ANTAR domain-containing protein [Loktanella sp. IMCC34160]|uniref:ANTAR domain-containing response regulator n=1 Tax=Loktanella sp. IMCC34160 TaxID=2510646 RepID=UPI001F5C48D9|nr:ANTAR domain-containing protein [Loktanella sp. IMCC34160]